MHTSLRSRSHRALLWPAALAAAAAMALAACSSTSQKTATTAPPATASPSTAAGSAGSTPSTPSGPSSSAGAAKVTVQAAQVPGVGTVLVNGDGRTLYLLTSEKGGKLTCTDSNGCTKYWPDTELPSGMTHGVAGSGVQASLLGTVRSADGSLYLTYAGYPLYTFSGDSASGQAKGQGIVSFGGTWWAISPSGAPVTAGSAPASGPATTAGSSGYGGGY